MTKRAIPLRSLAVIGIGLAVLVPILYYATTVDGRPPSVREISLTQHLTGDATTALTTTSIEVDFSEAVDHASAQTAFAIVPAIEGSFSWASSSLTFTPAARLPLRTEYAISINAGTRDTAGNRMTSTPAPFHFVTVGNPVVVSSDPADAASEVPLDAPIVVDFSTLMDTASVEGALTLSPEIDVRLSWSRERLTVAPVDPLGPNRRYSLSVGTGARDQAGTPLARPFELSFHTVVSGLAAEAIMPADGVEGIAVDTPIAIVFDRPLDPASVRDELFTITPSVGGSLDAVAAPGAAGLVDGGASVLRFQPSGPLDPNTTYQVTLGPGLLGADGSGLPGGLSWSFTTGAPAASLSNQVVFLSDRSGIANLWAMNPDGTNQRQLSAELSPVTDYAVAPDGSSFVVGDGAVIVWQRSDGAGRRTLTDAGVVEFDPAYSPDGTLISFGRADPAIGSGLGIWTRSADGSDLRPVELPSDGSASPRASPAAAAALLRAPRISPDGTALAFIDAAGSVAILDLELKQLSAAPFVALSAPVWLADSSGVLVAGVPAGSEPQRPYEPRTPVAVLDPVSERPAATRMTELRVVQLGRFASAVTQTAFGAGVAGPALDVSGRFAFIRYASPNATAGSPWMAPGLNDPGTEVGPGTGARVASVSFAPEPRVMLIGRVAIPGSDPTLTAGIWVLNLATGTVERLSSDGRLPRWLP